MIGEDEWDEEAEGTAIDQHVCLTCRISFTSVSFL